MKKHIESLEEKLSQTDFSHEGNKHKIKNNIFNNLEKNKSNIEGVEDHMKFEKRFNPKNIAVASLLCMTGFSAVAYGADIFEAIRSYTLGDHAEFMLPEREYSGNLIDNDIFYYDEEGNRLSEIPNYGSVVYSADGTMMFSVQSNENTTFDYSEVTLFNSFDDVKPYLAFNLLEPTVLPEGFYIDKIYLYNDEHGNIPEREMNYYLSYDLTNNEGHRIAVQVRHMNEETGFVASVTDNTEEIDINGHKGLLDEVSLNVYIDGVMYMFTDTGRNLSSDALIEMAKSLM